MHLGVENVWLQVVVQPENDGPASKTDPYQCHGPPPQSARGRGRSI